MKKSYSASHPWINFSLDFRRLPHSTWIALGEIAAMCDYIAGVPLRPAVAKRLHLIYLAKGASATTAIEGNTLTEQDVLKQIEGKLEVSPSKQYLVTEVENIVDACNAIFEKYLQAEECEITLEMIMDLNKRVLTGLPLPEGIIPGSLRQYEVGVPNYKAAPYPDCEFLLKRLGEWLNEPVWKKAEPQFSLIYAVIKAVIAHLYIAWIHPFGDGNGRTARLLEFLILIEAGVPQPATHLLSNHYNETRSEYYRQLDFASKSGGDVIPFISYAVQGFADGLRQQLGKIQKHQMDVAWINHIHIKLEGIAHSSRLRQKLIVEALSKSNRRVPKDQIALLSPELARIYAKKTPKTLSRDLGSLRKLKLIYKDEKGYTSNMNSIRAFLPARRERMEVPNNLTALLT